MAALARSSLPRCPRQASRFARGPHSVARCQVSTPGAASPFTPFSTPSTQRLFSARAGSAHAAADASSVSASAPAAAPRRTFYDFFPETLPAGPPPKGRFAIDVRRLRREFLQHQARTHPDLHPAAETKRRAETASALLNEAYRTLANPLLRAQYLLGLRGIDIAEDETMRVDEPALLATVLEAREEIEEAEAEEDLRHPRAVNDERIRRGEEALERAFRDDDVAAAKREAVRMRYWVNIKDSLDNWERGKPVVLEH